MKRNYYTLMGLALLTLPAAAQTQPKDTTVNRTVVVEQQYTPDILDAAKVNVLPKVEAPTVSKKPVEYATFRSPASNIPVGTMQAYVGKETQATTFPGYVRLGYGNQGNLDLLANYLFHLSAQDKLNVNFGMDGMNGTLDMPFGDARKWDAYYYRTRAQVDYVHQFSKLDLNVAGNFGLSNFNYEPYGHDFKKQKFTSGDIHFGVKSSDETLPVQFQAETNLLMYGRQHNLILYSDLTESIVRTKGKVTGAIGDEQWVGIGIEMNNLFYNKEKLEDYYRTVLYDSRTVLNLNPSYERNNDSWMLHVGVNVDFSFGGGKTLRVSPDITAQYLFSDSYVWYAKATGGRQLNDFRRLERFNPYADPSKEITDTYEQLNTRLGFKASPVPGLWFDLFGGYQNLKDDLYELPSGMIGGFDGDFIDVRQTSTNNLYAGAKASYQYKDLFSFSAEGTYYNWNAKDAQTETGSQTYNPALLMKPEFKFGFSAEVHPIPALWINLGYQYILRAEEYSSWTGKIPAVSNLGLGATYKVYKGVSVYVKTDNLLNKKFQNYLYYPVEGINFLGGLSFQF